VSLDTPPEIIQEKGNEHEVNAPNAPAALTPEVAAIFGRAQRRIGLLTEGGCGASPMPSRRFGRGTPRGKTKNFATKPTMCVKTKEGWTKCPKKDGHFGITFGHFRLTEVIFAGKSGLVKAICRLQVAVSRLFSCIIQPISEVE
jgi:hypothetical protein